MEHHLQKRLIREMARRCHLWIGVILIALVACDSTAAPAAEPTIAATEAAAPTPQATVVATLSPTAAEPEPTATPTAPPSVTPTPEASATPPSFATLDGFDDGLLLATHDGALIVYYPGRGDATTLLLPELYKVGGDDFLIPIIWPVRVSPDGQRVLIATPDDGTWLVGLDGASIQFHPQRLFATWSPDGRRIAFVRSTGQFEANPDGNIYVSEATGDASPEPLARVPGRALNALWSPGCEGDAPPEQSCGGHIAYTSQSGDALTVGVIDADSGEMRELGRFRPPPIGGTLWHRWAADGTAVIALADQSVLAFPLDGDGPRPLADEPGPGAPVPGLPSPDGTLYSRLERGPDGRSTLVVGSIETGQEVTASPDYSQGETFYWSGDGRYLLVSNYGCETGPCAYEIWATDTSRFPQLDDSTLVATGQAFLGPLSVLMERSTEVDARPWATVEALPAAGPPETWERHDAPELGLSFATPPWRVEIDGDTIIVANYEARTGGIVALPDDLFRVYGRWSDHFGHTVDYADLAAMEEMHFNWQVESIQAGGVAGVILRDRVEPVCDEALLPHRGGELSLLFCPATENWRPVINEFLAGLELAP